LFSYELLFTLSAPALIHAAALTLKLGSIAYAVWPWEGKPAPENSRYLNRLATLRCRRVGRRDGNAARKGVVNERAHLLRSAHADSASAWGNAQTIGGPILETQAFSFDLTLGGTGELRFLPLGARRRVVPVVAALAVMYTTRAIDWYALEIGRAAVTENPDE